MRKVNGRRTPSDGKSSHCLCQGELINEHKESLTSVHMIFCGLKLNLS
jgi:hypothetical protein